MMIGCSETQLAISGVSDSFGRRFIGALQDQAARSRAKHVSASDLLSVAMSIFENCKYDTPKLSSVYLGNKMKTETKQSPWNTSMTESETRELVRKYLCDGYFHHAHLGEMYIADYDNYIASRPAMFAIVFEYCPGTAFVTLEEFFRDRSCVEACEYGNEKFAQIFGPYVDYCEARHEEDIRKCDEMRRSAEREYLGARNIPSTTEKKEEPRKSIRIVIK